MTFGRPVWEQCQNDAVVSITVIRDGKQETSPGCMECWSECLSRGIEVASVVPLDAPKPVLAVDVDESECELPIVEHDVRT